jgi:mono/diheme cytochrome c family protein
MWRVCILAVVSAVTVACGDAPPPEARDLPAGDPAAGRQAFVALQCHACHDVEGESLPAPAIVPSIHLGGKRLLLPSPERLATDILLPSSHFAVGYPAQQIAESGRSRMPDYSERLDKQTLANLAAYLQSKYTRGVPTGMK